MLVSIMPVIIDRVLVRPEQRDHLTLQAAVHGGGAVLLTGCAYRIDRDVRGEIQVGAGNRIDRRPSRYAASDPCTGRATARWP